MDFLNAVAGWARRAWGDITGAASDLGGAFSDVWHFITSVHGLVSWLFGIPFYRWLASKLEHSRALGHALDAATDVLERLGAWIKTHYIDPQVRRLDTRITNLFNWAKAQLWLTWLHIELRYRQARAYAAQLTAIERAARIKADKAEHASMLQHITALHQAIELEASSGYNTGTPDRKTVIGRLLDDLALKDPAVKALVQLLANAVFDLETVDNPVVRWAIQKTLNEIIGHLGIDQAVTGLIQRLLGPLAGDPRPGDLYGVEKDTAARLGALEAQWAEFMTSGGPEVEQAGKAWKSYTSVIADAALLAWLGEAVTEPAAWAGQVTAVLGNPVNAALTGIVDLINSA